MDDNIEIKEKKASPEIETKLEKLLKETKFEIEEAKIYWKSLSISERNKIKEELEHKDKSNWEKELTYDEIVKYLKKKNREKMQKSISEWVEKTGEETKKKEKNHYLKWVEKTINLKLKEKLWWWIMAWIAVTVMWWFWLWTKDLISNYENNSEEPWIFDWIKQVISEKILNWLWIKGIDENLKKLNEWIENAWDKMWEWVDHVKNKVWAKVK